MRHYLVGAVLLVLVPGLVFLIWLNQSWSTTLKLEQPVLVEVVRGDSLSAIASKLENDGVIESARLFQWLVEWQESGSSLKSGEYRFEGEVSPEGVLETLTKGRVTSYSIRLIEGQTFADYVALLRNSPRLVDDIEGLTVENALERFDIQHGTSHAEGYFFPDTYFYQVGDSASSILQRSHELMDDELERAWKERSESLPIDTIEELLIVASLIEKETSWPADLPRVSGVIHRRLEKRMRLQLDPTVIYALGDLYDGDIKRSDLKTPSPYNTYLEYGLPPTPICSPGQAAILAAVKPADNDELYFVSRGDGTSEFSTTLAQHNRAVRKYQR